MGIIVWKRKCPHCGKEFEIEQSVIYPKVKLRKNPRRDWGKEFDELTKISKKIDKKGLSDRIMPVMEDIKELAKKHKSGIPYAKIKSVTKLKEAELNLILESLKRAGEIYEPAKDVFKVV